MRLAGIADDHAGRGWFGRHAMILAGGIVAGGDFLLRDPAPAGSL
jgi:hypothetical protein